MGVSDGGKSFELRESATEAVEEVLYRNQRKQDQKDKATALKVESQVRVQAGSAMRHRHLTFHPVVVWRQRQAIGGPRFLIFYIADTLLAVTGSALCCGSSVEAAKKTQHRYVDVVKELTFMFIHWRKIEKVELQLPVFRWRVYVRWVAVENAWHIVCVILTFNSFLLLVCLTDQSDRSELHQRRANWTSGCVPGTSLKRRRPWYNRAGSQWISRSWRLRLEKPLWCHGPRRTKRKRRKTW